jgi:hypothetical protein
LPASARVEQDPAPYCAQRMERINPGRLRPL